MKERAKQQPGNSADRSGKEQVVPVKSTEYSNRDEGLRREEKEGEGMRERRAGEKEHKTGKGREGCRRKVAKRKGTTTTRVGERGREGNRRLMRHAHVGTCLRPHPRSPRTSINNPSTPARSENCR